MKTIIDFTENGIHFHAERGLAFARKDGKDLWRSLDVYTMSVPTRESVLELHDVMTGFLGGESDFGKVAYDPRRMCL